MTLASYYWFSQTPLYSRLVGSDLDLSWQQLLRFLMLGLSFLMISNVSYAAVPTIGYRSPRAILGSVLVIGTVIGVVFLPRELFFLALMGYVVFGLGQTVFDGLLERRPARGAAPSAAPPEVATPDD